MNKVIADAFNTISMEFSSKEKVQVANEHNVIRLEKENEDLKYELDLILEMLYEDGPDEYKATCIKEKLEEEGLANE